LVDAGTAGRIAAAGVDAHALLDNNDSFAALEAAHDLLITQATGTNVADVQVLLIAP
jgi:hydroxypyruvate reductase